MNERQKQALKWLLAGQAIDWYKSTDREWHKWTPGSPVNPLVDADIQWRLMRPEWQHRIIEAAQNGERIDILNTCGQWVETDFHIWKKQMLGYDFEDLTEEFYRIKSQQPEWQLKLIEQAKAGAVVEVCDDPDAPENWWPSSIATELEKHFFVHSESHGYRVKPKRAVRYAYSTPTSIEYSEDDNTMQSNGIRRRVWDNLKLTFEGTELISAEILK